MLNKLKDRIRARFSVSVCEIGDTERHQVARIAIATVARDAASCRQVIAAVRSVAETLTDAWLTDAKGEILSFGANGDGLRGGIESLELDGIDSDAYSPEHPSAVPANTAGAVQRKRIRRKEH